MSTTIARPQHGFEESGAMVVRPQSQSVGMMAEAQRVQAEIQAALTVAKSCPRDEKRAMERIETACQRTGLAECAEYSYSRGGTEITGPTIDLLTVIANQWGNVTYGFRELSQRNGESEVEAFAWDLETNSKRNVTFTVPHKRVTKRDVTTLTDPRDIYEMVANNAQRRVRACLEAIIPPDVVENAVLQCRATLKESADVTPDGIKKLVEAYEKIGVTKEQIEARLGRRLDSIQPAQLVSMRRIYKSISDGMSQPQDWFAAKEGEQPQPETATASVKDVLKKKAAKATDEAPKETPKAESKARVTVDPKEGESPADYWLRAMRAQPTLETLNAVWAEAEADPAMDPAETSFAKGHYEKLAKGFQ